MTRFVVDASVAIKWFVREVHAEAAKRLLDPGHELTAPDLIWPEFGNVLWKKRRLGEITADTARRILLDFQRFPMTTAPVRPLIEAALEIANGLDRSVYDSLYLALADRTSCRLVTADLKLFNALRSGPLASRALWLEDVP